MAPLLSVIIPTHKRPQFLPRAIDSALLSAPNGDVEVIVVPNGPDTSWKAVAEQYQGEPRVIWSPIATAHANAARNHGMDLAKGKYIRFLDDDDYLLITAQEQIELMEKQGANFCSSLTESKVDTEGSLGVLSFPKTDDFVVAALSHSSFRLPCSNVFLAIDCKKFCWDESVNRAQDLVWMLALARSVEWKWLHLNKITSVWFQHKGERTSTVDSSKMPQQEVIEYIFYLAEYLEKNGDLNEDRKEALASLIWYYINRHFIYRPFYWSKIAARANKIYKKGRPSHRLFHIFPVKFFPSLFIEWLVFPLRYISYMFRKLKVKFKGEQYTREL